MTGPPHDTGTGTPHRADAGAVRLGRRDIDGLILCAEHFGAPYDLLASALEPRIHERFPGTGVVNEVSGSPGTMPAPP
jgi:hypothetical protein